MVAIFCQPWQKYYLWRALLLPYTDFKHKQGIYEWSYFQRRWSALHLPLLLAFRRNVLHCIADYRKCYQVQYNTDDQKIQ